MYDDAVHDELKFWGYLFDVGYTDPNSLDAFQYLSPVPTAFCAIIFACENAKNTQSSWLTDVVGKVLLCTFTKK